MASDLKIQRGVTSVNANGDTTTLATPVSDISRAFLRINNSRHTSAGDQASGSNHEGDDLSLAGYLSDVDQITWIRSATLPGRDATAYWEVVEYVGDPGGDNEFIVRDRSLVDMTATLLTDETISGVVDPDRCIPYITGTTTADTADGANGTAMVAYLTSATNLRVEVGESDSFAKSCHVTTVEFVGSNWSVGHGRVTGQTADTGTISLVSGADGVSGTSFDVGDWATAEISSWGHKGDGVNQAIADNWARLIPGASTTTVSWFMHSNHDGTDDDHVVHVLKHPDLFVSRTTLTHNAAGEAYADVSGAGFTDLALSSVLITGSSSGSGTAYGRGWRSIRLQTLTDAQTFCHRSGNTCSWSVQAINYDGIQSAGAPGESYDTSGSISGGGSIAGSASGGRGRSVTVSGGGVVTGSCSTARSDASSVAGGGVLSVSVARSAGVTVSPTGGGGGAVVVASSKTSGGSVAGGGTVTATGYRSASVLGSISGGGTVGLTALHATAASVVAQGGGSVVAGVAPLALAQASVVGGGQAAVSAAASMPAQLGVSGGGDTAMSGATDRRVQASVVGGGAVSALAIGDASAGASVSGGGDLGVSVSSTVSVSLSVSGGGSNAVSVSAGARAVQGSTSGGGSLTGATLHEGWASVSVTGGGTITLASGVSSKVVAASVSGSGGISVTAGKSSERGCSISGGGNLGNPITGKGVHPAVTIRGGGEDRATIVSARGPGLSLPGSGQLVAVVGSDRSLAVVGSGGGELVSSAAARLLLWELAEFTAGEAASQWFESLSIQRWGAGVSAQSWETRTARDRWGAAPCEPVLSQEQ